MADEKKPSIYSDRGTIGSADELDEYGVWVKSEPQDLSSVNTESQSTKETLPDLGDLSDFEDITLPDMEDLPDFDVKAKTGDGDFTIPDMEDLSDFDSPVEEKPLSSAGIDDAFDLASDNTAEIPDDFFDMSDIDFGEETAKSTQDKGDSDTVSLPHDFPKTSDGALERGDVFTEVSMQDFLNTVPGDLNEPAFTEPFADAETIVTTDVPGDGETAAPEPSLPPKEHGYQPLPAAEPKETKPPELDLSTQLLMQIASELSSIKMEISSLKQELSGIRNVPPAEKETDGGGFFGEGQDEKIALTGDELNNILNTANFIEEAGTDVAENTAEALTLEDKTETEPAESQEFTGRFPEVSDYIPEESFEAAGPIHDSDVEEDFSDAISFEDTVDIPVEDQMDLPHEDSAEFSLEDQTELPLEDSLDFSLEDQTELPHEDSAEFSLEDQTELLLGDSADFSLEDQAEPPLEDTAEFSLEDQTDLSLEDTTDFSLEEQTEPPLEDTAEFSLEDQTDLSLEDTVDLSPEDQTDLSVLEELLPEEPLDIPEELPGETGIQPIQEETLEDLDLQSPGLGEADQNVQFFEETTEQPDVVEPEDEFIDIDISDEPISPPLGFDYIPDELPPQEDSSELYLLQEEGVIPMTEAPSDTSYLDDEVPGEDNFDEDTLDLSNAVIEEPDLSGEVVENPIQEPSLESISIDLELEESLELPGEDAGEVLELPEDVQEEISIDIAGEDFASQEAPPALSLDTEKAQEAVETEVPDIWDETGEVSPEEDFAQVVPEDLVVEADDTQMPFDNALALEETIPEEPDESGFLYTDAGEAAGEETPAQPNVPDNLKQELKVVLSYMDQLLESLPEEKIEEFARSEYYNTYKKLFEELGLV